MKTHNTTPGSIVWMRRIIGWAALVLPLFYFPGFLAYLSPKFYLLGTLGFALVPLLIYTWLSMPQVLWDLVKGKWAYGMKVYLLALIIVGFASMSPALSFFGTFARGTGVFTFLFLGIIATAIATIAQVEGWKGIKSILTMSVIGGALYSALLMFTVEGIGTWFADANGGATIGNSSVAASYMLWNIFFIFVLWYTAAKKTRWQWLWAAIPSALSPLFLNWHALSQWKGITSIIGQARGATMGIAIGIVVAIGMWCVYQKTVAKKVVGWSIVALVFIGSIFAGSQLLNPTSKLHASFDNAASGTRFIFWDIATKGFNDNRVLGNGPDTFTHVFHKHFDADMLLRAFNNENLNDRAHNLVFQTMTDGGYVLLLGMLVFFISIVGVWSKAVREDRVPATVAAAMIGAFAAWFIQAQFVFESPLSLLMLFMVAGIGYGIAAQSDGHIKHMTQMKSGIVGIGAVAAIVGFWFVIVMPFQKETTLYAIAHSTLADRAVSWGKVVGGTPMGERQDTVLLFTDIYRAYFNGAEKIHNGDAQTRAVAAQELAGINTYLESVLARNPDFYEVELLAAEFQYIHMYITDDFKGEILASARAHLARAMELSPTDPLPIFIKVRIDGAAGSIASIPGDLTRAIALQPKLQQGYLLMLQYAQARRDVKLYNATVAQANLAIPDFEKLYLNK